MDKIYLAIGKMDGQVRMRAGRAATMADFNRDLRRNEFSPYITMTERIVNEVLDEKTDNDRLWEIITGRTTNKKSWLVIREFILQSKPEIGEILKEVQGG